MAPDLGNQSLQIEGGQRQDRMMFNGSYVGDDGKSTLIRALWWPMRDGVRERAEISDDETTQQRR